MKTEMLMEKDFVKKSWLSIMFRLDDINDFNLLVRAQKRSERNNNRQLNLCDVIYHSFGNRESKK